MDRNEDVDLFLPFAQLEDVVAFLQRSLYRDGAEASQNFDKDCKMSEICLYISSMK
jgi:hypothetical protein